MPVIKETKATHAILGSGTSTYLSDLGVRKNEETYLVAAHMFIESGTQTGMLAMGITDLIPKPKQSILPNTPVWGPNQELSWHGHFLLERGDYLYVVVQNGTLNDGLYYSYSVEKHI